MGYPIPYLENDDVWQDDGTRPLRSQAWQNGDYAAFLASLEQGLALGERGYERALYDDLGWNPTPRSKTDTVTQDDETHKW